MALKGSLSTPSSSFVAEFRRNAIQKLERVALRVSDQMASEALKTLRQDMTAAGLGTLGNAIGYGSDLKKGGRVYRFGRDGFSASGWLFIRSGSQRSRGAIDAYVGTGTTTITPKRSKYLWIPSGELQRVVGRGTSRRRLTPALYAQSGLERRLGPLVRITSSDGTPLLIIRNVGVNAAGRGGVKSLKKNGQPRRGQIAKEFIVAFIGIPFTSRAARVDAIEIARKVQANSRQLLAAALGER